MRPRGRGYVFSSLIFLFLVLFLSFIFYQDSLNFQYVNLDDALLIKYRFSYIFNPANIINSFKTNVMYLSDSTAFYYRPILTISFILDALFFKDNFRGYHLTNIVLHLVSIILVYKLMLRLEVQIYVALFVTLIFALHPVLMQTIAWVPGRNDSLLLVFSISNFFYFLNYLKSGGLKDFLFFLFFAFLSVFVKETAIFFLVILLAYLFLILDWKKHIKRSLLVFSAFMVIFVLWYFMALNFSDKQGSYLGYLVHTNWLSYFPRVVIPGYLTYFGKIVWPFNLSVFPILDLTNSNIKFGILFLIFLFLSFFLFVSKKRRKIFVFGLIWFLVLLFPTFVNLMPGEPNIIYEHRLYLPLVGLLLSFSQINFVRLGLSYRKVFLLLSLLVVIFFWKGNRNHIFAFKDSRSFWEDAYLNSSQHFVTEVGLSGVYLSEGEIDKAEEVFRKLAEIKPDTEISHLGFASLYYNKKEYEKSLQELEKVLKINPKSVRAMQYMGSIKEKQEDYEEAEKYYLEALKIDNQNIDLLMGLVAFYVRRGRIEDAKKIYSQVQSMGISF
ncbi:MAG: hypothetical protein KatS3mg088_615 [Patescibacteria group bacterium]|nr:MAG: hypothetical protein KatS3mg088_615 [Patescibacteria group bacterium]